MEHSRIDRYFAPLATAEAGAFALRDDAACLAPPVGKTLVVTTDSVMEGVHVLAGATPPQFAHKLIRRNLSDLAAMGAVPWRYTLNLHLPRDTPDIWVEEFAATLAEEQAVFGCVLVGGDSTVGARSCPIHTTMTLFGLLEASPLTRTGARVGEDLYVSGTIGDAALGLQQLQRGGVADGFLADRYHLPQPRLALGQALHGVATAALDISDGLLADALQLGRASGVGVEIVRDAVPLSVAASAAVSANTVLWEMILSGGDDYELCFTAPVSAREALALLAARLNLALTRVGHVVAEAGVVVRDVHGNALPIAAYGFTHG